MEASRHGHRNRGREASNLSRGLDERCGHEGNLGVVNGEALCQRGSREVRQRRRTDPRWIRFYKRLSRREVLSRCETVHHRRRHQRNSAPGDCTAVAEGLNVTRCKKGAIEWQKPYSEPQSLHSPGTKHPKTSAKAIAPHTCEAFQSPSPWQYSPPNRLVRTDTRPVRQLPNQIGGNPVHRLP